MKQTREMRRYLNQIRRLIPSDYAGKRDVMGRIKSRAGEYTEEYPDTSVADFEAQFGTPEEVADSFLEELSGSRRERRLRQRGLLFAVVGCALLIASLLLVRYTFYLIEHTAVETTETLTIYTNEPAPWEKKKP